MRNVSVPLIFLPGERLKWRAPVIRPVSKERIIMKMSPGPYYKKGSQLVATGKVRPMGDGQYTVQSESGENEYSVDQNGCSCPTAQFRPYVMLSTIGL